MPGNILKVLNYVIVGFVAIWPGEAVLVFVLFGVYTEMTLVQ